MRQILHVDMDAFYASIEERAEPALKTKPLIVARDPRKNRGKGVVATANYEARKYGVHSAMSSAKALELCPQAVFRFSGFELYREVSQQIHTIFHQVTDEIEAYALDEAYLDITDNKLAITDPIKVARLIQAQIYEQTQLTCSVGVSYNKFLAKEASDFAKPVGLTVIDHRDAPEFLMRLPIAKFRGVGKKTIPKMQKLGINSGADLIKWSQIDLINQFGKFGYILYQRVRGIDERPVESHRIRKSIGRERTFNPELQTETEITVALKKIAQQLVTDINLQRKHGKTLVLKVRDADFTTYTKRMTFDNYLVNDVANFVSTANDLLLTVPNLKSGIRLLGITITNLAATEYQNMDLELF